MKKRSGIAKQLTHMTILPLVIISIVTLFISILCISTSMAIVKDVISSNESAFYQNVSINGSSYYCYYEPIRDSNAKCIGMFATATPSKRV